MIKNTMSRQNRYNINLIKINCHLSPLQTTVKPVYTVYKANFTSPNVRTLNYTNLYKPKIVYSESKSWFSGGTD
jgi:ribosomal protein L18E